jgi:hypothetical protein
MSNQDQIERMKTDQKQEKSDKKHEIEIIINGTPVLVQKRQYSYDEIYSLAFPGQPIPTGAEIPITYKLPHGHHEGVLLPGGKVEVQKGMVFNVQPTIKS